MSEGHLEKIGNYQLITELTNKNSGFGKWGFAVYEGKQYFTAKSTLDKFYKTINTYGKITFKIAFHAYPQGLVDPVFWDDSLAIDSTKSMIVTFRNLSVLTKYVKKNFGKDYLTILRSKYG